MKSYDNLHLQKLMKRKELYARRLEAGENYSKINREKLRAQNFGSEDGDEYSRKSRTNRDRENSFEAKQRLYKVGNQYLEASKKLTLKAKGFDLKKMSEKKNMRILKEQKKMEKLKKKRPKFGSQILSPHTVTLQSSLLDPRRVDRVRKLQRDINRVKDGKDYSKIHQRMSLIQNQGYNDYLRGEHSTNNREYIREMEKGDKKLIGVLNSKLNLLQKIEENRDLL